ncbi:MAG: hypothetical protein IKX75_08425, partial [Desulfovibrio sp.]|nr:hypothetical protein [Desulfovibrio sp.]
MGLLEVLSDAIDREHASLLTSGAGWLAATLCRCGLPARKKAYAASPSGVLEKDWEDCTTAAMPGLLHGPAEDAVRAALARPG